MAINYATNKFGDVTTCDGIVVHLTEQAAAENKGTEGGVEYIARGVDDAGNKYRVTWQTLARTVDCDDESAACDWDEYTIEAI